MDKQEMLKDELYKDGPCDVMVAVRANKIYELRDRDTVTGNSPRETGRVEVEPKFGTYKLREGLYRVEFDSELVIPEGAFGYVYPTDELMWAGAYLISRPFWEGESTSATLQCSRSVDIEEGAVIGSLHLRPSVGKLAEEL